MIDVLQWGAGGGFIIEGVGQGTGIRNLEL